MHFAVLYYCICKVYGLPALIRWPKLIAFDSMLLEMKSAMLLNSYWHHPSYSVSKPHALFYLASNQYLFSIWTDCPRLQHNSETPAHKWKHVLQYIVYYCITWKKVNRNSYVCLREMPEGIRRHLKYSMEYNKWMTKCCFHYNKFIKLNFTE